MLWGRRDARCRDAMHCVSTNNKTRVSTNTQTRYKNQYRIASTRLRNWDYGWNAAYFVTMCTQNRECFFGKIVIPIVETQCIASLQDIHPKIQLSKIGRIAENEWIKIPQIRPDMNLTLGEFIVMPNHFHGIIIIGENHYNTNQGTQKRRDAMHCVSTTVTTTQNQFGPQCKNLASIIRGFKIGVTKNARKINPDFAWQPRFYDHIIRDDESHHKISEYISNNPFNWTEDDYYEK